MGEWTPGGGGGSGGGGAPSGPAGGTLAGTYPNPTIPTLPSLALVDVVKEYGVAPSNSAATNATLIQNALNDNVGRYATFLPFFGNTATTYNYDTTLVIPSGGRLVGPGNSTGGPILNYVGADATNGIQMTASPLASACVISGFRLVDGRTSPTSGIGIYWIGTNANMLTNMSVNWHTDSGIQLGDIGKSSDNYYLSNVWCNGATQGLYIVRVSENCIIENIRGNADGGTPSATQTSIIRLGASPGGGFTNVVIIGAMTEVGSLAGTVSLLQIDSTFAGSVTGFGLKRSGAGNSGIPTVIHNDSTSIVGWFFGVSTEDYASGVNLLTDSVDSLVVGGGSTSPPIFIDHGVAPTGFLNWSKMRLGGLPTADPHVVGQVWSNSGVVTVSAG